MSRGARPDVDRRSIDRHRGVRVGPWRIPEPRARPRFWFQSGELVPILVDWCEERYPLYAYYASRQLPPAKIRAFLDFVLEIAAEAPSAAQGTRPTSRSKAGRSVK